jgi:hypothetical protein
MNYYDEIDSTNIGCAEWHSSEVRPTPEDVKDATIADFSNFDNVRKLARIIALKNSMAQAAMLTGELSYAYQNLTYDCAAASQSLQGLSDSKGLQQVKAFLDTAKLEGCAQEVVMVLTGIIEDAIAEEIEQEKRR